GGGGDGVPDRHRDEPAEPGPARAPATARRPSRQPRARSPEVTDRDWMLLNAYADGELGRAETAALSARLARDPELAEELRRIRRLKQRLTCLQGPDRPPGAAATARPLRPLAVAASLAVAAVIACIAMIGPAGGPGGDRSPVLALHSE